MKREKPLGTDEAIKECIEGAGFEQKMAGQVRRNFEMVLDSMIAHTLQDGRTRRIGDYFSLRLDIAGSFDRPDAQFDPAKHSLTLNFVTPKCLRRMTRKVRPGVRFVPDSDFGAESTRKGAKWPKSGVFSGDKEVDLNF